MIRGENLALLGDSSDDGPLIEAPLDVVLRRQAQITETLANNQQNSRNMTGGVAVDLGFLDDI